MRVEGRCDRDRSWRRERPARDPNRTHSPARALAGHHATPASMTLSFTTTLTEPSACDGTGTNNEPLSYDIPLH
jgi:hypothetical protein